MTMDITNSSYPHDHARFQKEIHLMTQAEIESWLTDVPEEPAPGATEAYEQFMQRQAYYTKHLNMMIVARDEHRAQGDRLAIMPPPVGDDIVEVIDWIQRTGETPIEYLTKTYRSSSAKTEHRISAARTLMDYVHRKMPHTIDVKDTRKNAEQEAANSDLLKKIEEMLSGAVQEKKQLQRVK